MAYLPPKAQILYSDYQATLASLGTITSGWLDMEQFDKVQFSGYSDVAGMTMRIESKVNNTTAPTQLNTPVVYNDGGFYMFNVICRQRYMKFTWENTTGGLINDASMEIKGFIGSSDKLSVFPVGVQPSDFSQASLSQSILRGKDINGSYQNVSVNPNGELQTARYSIDAARGEINGITKYDKFGDNHDIDTTSAPEDVWEGAGLYTGFDVTAGEAIEVLSDSASDTGTLVSSGTATGGSSTTIEDTGATFITDGVAVGDIILNDTNLWHGIVKAVTSETVLTVHFWNNNDDSTVSFSSGDSYRVVTNGSTGASVVKLNNCLETDYAEYISEYVILNGTTPVDTVGTDYIRNSRATVVLSASDNGAIGNLQGRQTTTTGNVFWTIDVDHAQTHVCCDTVPAGKTLYMWATCHISRASGSAGSAKVKLLKRPIGEPFQDLIETDITTSNGYVTQPEEVYIVPQCSDIKWQVDSVSDNNTSVTAEFDGYLINNT